MIRKVAAAILSEDRQRILAVRKRGRDIFILPGGRQERDETTQETLKRELREELGLEVTEMTPLLTATDLAAFEADAIHLTVFLVVVHGEMQVGHEIVETAFVPQDWESTGLRFATGITNHVLPHLFGNVRRQETHTTPHRESRTDRPRGAEPVALLFSGGRDSTAVAQLLHESGHYLHLLTFTSGMAVGKELLPSRLEELRTIWPDGSFEVHRFPIEALVREICFKNLVNDILEDREQLVLLGEALAMIVRALEFCLACDVRTLAMGASGYQEHFPEQQRESLKAISEFAAEFGVTFLTPGTAWSSELEVKDRLRLAGLTTKSLERTSIFADIADHPAPECVRSYLQRKLPWLRAYLTERNRVSSM